MVVPPSRRVPLAGRVGAGIDANRREAKNIVSQRHRYWERCMAARDRLRVRRRDDVHRGYRHSCGVEVGNSIVSGEFGWARWSVVHLGLGVHGRWQHLRSAWNRADIRRSLERHAMVYTATSQPRERRELAQWALLHIADGLHRCWVVLLLVLSQAAGRALEWPRMGNATNSAPRRSGHRPQRRLVHVAFGVYRGWLWPARARAGPTADGVRGALRRKTLVIPASPDSRLG